jgi:hypothetical protein
MLMKWSDSWMDIFIWSRFCVTSWYGKKVAYLKTSSTRLLGNAVKAAVEALIRNANGRTVNLLGEYEGTRTYERDPCLPYQQISLSA